MSVRALVKWLSLGMAVYGFSGVALLLLFANAQSMFGFGLNPDTAFVVALIPAASVILGRQRLYKFMYWAQTSVFVENRALRLSAVYTYLAVFFGLLPIVFFVLPWVQFESIILALVDVIFMAFFIQKFIDMNIMGCPQAVLTHFFIWGFLATTAVPYVWAITALFGIALPRLGANLDFILFLLLYGSASYLIFQERGAALMDAHPQYYMSLAHQAFYTLVLVNGLMLNSTLTMVHRWDYLTVAFVVAMAVVTVMNPLNWQLVRFYSWSARLKITKDGRKFLRKVERDSWQRDVQQKSRLAGTEGTLSLAIGVFGLYVGAVLLIRSMIVWNFGSMVQGLLLVWLGIAPTLYGIRRRAMPYQYREALGYLRLFRITNPEDLRHTFEALVLFYVGLLPALGIMQFWLGSKGDIGEAKLAFGVTVSQMIFFLLIFGLILAVATFAVLAGAFGRKEYSEEYLRRLKRVQSLLVIPLWLMISAFVGIGGLLLQINSTLVAALMAIIVFLFATIQIYLSFMKGEEARHVS